VDAPFSQLDYAALPERPRRAHGDGAMRTRRVTVRSDHFGTVGIHLRELGEGEPLLLIHGLMTTGYSWRYVVEQLSRRFRVLVPDLVGCGRSDKPVAHYGPRHVARFIGELMTALDVRGCDVVGNSMGGYLCMWLALDEPDAMRRLMNVHSPGTPLARLFALRGALTLPGSERLLSWMVARDPYRWAHRNVHYWDERLKSLEEAREYGEPLAHADGRRAFASYLRETLDPRDMRAFVARLRAQPFAVPLELVYATRDPMVPPAVGRALAALIGRAELVWLDDCSHFAHVDRPEAIIARIEGFMGRPPDD
jgi:pimeloyl-ACP methyl ester carboxylesterase